MKIVIVTFTMNGQYSNWYFKNNTANLQKLINDRIMKIIAIRV